MIPSNGRIVHFRNPDPDEKNETLDHLCSGGYCITAIVVGTDRGRSRVTLDVRWPWAADYGGPAQRCHIFHDVQEGYGPGQWHSPERVE